MTKRKWKIITALVIVIAVGYYWNKKNHSTAQAIQYKTVTAEKNSITASVSGSGNVIVDQLATVDPTITGTVSDLKVKVGDNVKKGDVLFTIVNNDLSVSNDQAAAQLQQSQNSIDSAELQVKQAKADYDAAKKSDTTSSDQKKVLKDKISIAEQGVTAAQKSYTATLASYNNTLANGAKRIVTSPIEGTVSAINVKNGDDLARNSSSSSSSNAPIIIGDLKTLKAQVQVNEVDIPNVSIGQKVMMTFGAIDGLTATGKVEKIDALGTLSQGVVTYNVLIDFDSVDPRIKPQMSVSAKIITQVKNDVIAVPNSALKTQGNTTYIQVMTSSSQVPQMRVIEPGLANSSETEIVSGINEGEVVVTQTIDPNAKANTSSSNNIRGFGGFSGGGRGG